MICPHHHHEVACHNEETSELEALCAHLEHILEYAQDLENMWLFNTPLEALHPNETPEQIAARRQEMNMLRQLRVI